MDHDIIFESASAIPTPGVNFPALVPFSAMTHRELAQIVTPASFSQMEPSSTLGLRWAATGVVVSTDHGTYKLYLCQRRGLAMWVPSGEWFYTNQAPPANQSIAQYAERHSKTKIRPKPYDRPERRIQKGFEQRALRKSLKIETYLHLNHHHHFIFHLQARWWQSKVHLSS